MKILGTILISLLLLSCSAQKRASNHIQKELNVALSAQILSDSLINCATRFDITEDIKEKKKEFDNIKRVSTLFEKKANKHIRFCNDNEFKELLSSLKEAFVFFKFVYKQKYFDCLNIDNDLKFLKNEN